MARGYRWLSAADEDEIWARCGLGMRPSQQLERWGCRRVGCGPIWCGVAGSGLLRGVGRRAG